MAKSVIISSMHSATFYSTAPYVMYPSLYTRLERALLYRQLASREAYRSQTARICICAVVQRATWIASPRRLESGPVGATIQEEHSSNLPCPNGPNTVCRVYAHLGPRRDARLRRPTAGPQVTSGGHARSRPASGGTANRRRSRMSSLRGHCQSRRRRAAGRGDHAPAQLQEKTIQTCWPAARLDRRYQAHQVPLVQAHSKYLIRRGGARRFPVPRLVRRILRLRYEKDHLTSLDSLRAG